MAASPAYQRIADELRAEIAAGKWRPGEQLPAENDLVEQFNVSRNTVRQALTLLAQVNLVRRQQGSGTFVNEQGVTHTLGDLKSFTQVMTDLGMTPGIRNVQVFSDPAPPQEALDFLPGKHLWLASRVRLNEGRPFCLMESWLPDDIGSKISSEMLEDKQSLYSVFQDLGLSLREASEKIRAEAADERVAAALEVPVGFPLLTIYRWTSDRSGRPVEYVRSFSPGDRYEYFVKLTQ
jgi:GntR family transcriptional regulator